MPPVTMDYGAVASNLQVQIQEKSDPKLLLLEGCLVICVKELVILGVCITKLTITICLNFYPKFKKWGLCLILEVVMYGSSYL